MERIRVVEASGLAGEGVKDAFVWLAEHAEAARDEKE